MYREIYMHNPLYYELDDEQKIPFELLDSKSSYSNPNLLVFSKGIYTSVENVQNALNLYFELHADNPDIMEREEEITESINSIYNEEYFQKNILVVTDIIETGSISNHQEVYSVYIKDNTLYIFVKMYFADTLHATMQYTKFRITIDRDYIENIDTLKQTMLYKHPKYTPEYKK